MPLSPISAVSGACSSSGIPDDPMLRETPASTSLGTHFAQGGYRGGPPTQHRLAVRTGDHSAGETKESFLRTRGLRTVGSVVRCESAPGVAAL